VRLLHANKFFLLFLLHLKTRKALFFLIRMERVNITEEEWAFLPDDMRLSAYMFSSLGKVYSFHRKRNLSGTVDKFGYVNVHLTNDEGELRVYRLARLVYHAFKPTFDKSKTVDHKNRQRGDNSLSNLREATMREQNLNKGPVCRHHHGSIIMQICTHSGATVSYWLSPDEIFKKYGDVNQSLLKQSLENCVPTELEGFFWVWKAFTTFKDLDFVWVKAVAPTNKWNIDMFDFEVCRQGLIKRNGIITPGFLNDSLYRKINFKGRAFFVHRIIYATFNGPLEQEFFVDHVDTVTTNNNASNLEKVTPRENTQRRFDLLRKREGLRVVRSISQYDMYGKHLATFTDQWDAEEKTGVSRKRILSCLWGEKITAKGFYWRLSFPEDANNDLEVDLKHTQRLQTLSCRWMLKNPLIMRKITGSKAVYVQEFENMEAVLSYLHTTNPGKQFHESSIWSCLPLPCEPIRKCKSAYGYVWEWKTQETKTEIPWTPPLNTPRKVSTYEKTSGVLFEKFESVLLSAQTHNVSPTTIRDYIRGKLTHPTLIFRYDEEILRQPASHPRRMRKQQFVYAQYACDGTLIQKYRTLEEAATTIQKEQHLQTKLKSLCSIIGNISTCRNPRSKTGYTYQWRRYSPTDQIPLKIPSVKYLKRKRCDQ
jgi:hypothetical protein